MRRFFKSLLLWPLRFRAVRNRVLFWARQEQYPELELRVPLSRGFACPILSPEYWCSFSEIFVQREYAPVLDLIPPPSRWIDLGCHAGFFSLYLAWERSARGIGFAPECLLADADARVRGSVERIGRINQLGGVHFEMGAVGAGAAADFVERGFMASGVRGLDAQPGAKRQVPVLTQERVIELLPPPYDLLKADIEGSEHDLLRHYPRVLDQTRQLLLEWHSWHGGGGGKEQLVEMARTRGFGAPVEIQPPREVSPGRQCGILLFANERFAERAACSRFSGAL